MLHPVCQKRRRPPMILLHFALPTPFLSLPLNLFVRYMITYIPRVYLLASFFFFFNCFRSSQWWFLHAARRRYRGRRWIFVFDARPFPLSSSLLSFPLIFVGRSSWEGLRRKVFVGRSLSEGLCRKFPLWLSPCQSYLSLHRRSLNRNSCSTNKTCRDDYLSIKFYASWFQCPVHGSCLRWRSYFQSRCFTQSRVSQF